MKSVERRLRPHFKPLSCPRVQIHASPTHFLAFPDVTIYRSRTRCSRGKMRFEQPFSSPELTGTLVDSKLDSEQLKLEELNRKVARTELRVKIAQEVTSRLKHENTSSVGGATYATVERDMVVREWVNPRDWPNAGYYLKTALRRAVLEGYDLEDARAAYGEIIHKYVPEFDISGVEPE